MRWLVRRIARISSTAMLRASGVLTILALALMVWSMMQPTPLPVMLAMSVGQLIGTIAFALYGIAVAKDVFAVRRARRAAAESDAKP
jgi:hypothetical protein